MALIKKLALAPAFLLIFITLLYQLSPLLSSYEYFFSLETATLTQLITVALFFSFSSFLFSLFAALADDWKIVLPLALLSSLLSFIFIPPALALILAVSFFVSFLLTFLSLSIELKSYLTFQPNKLLGPAVRHLSGLLILSFCLVYFFSSSKMIAQNGFEIPDSLIDTALKIAAPKLPEAQNPQSSLPSIPQEQIEMLKKNPQLLKQFGLDPSVLDSLSQSKSSSSLQDQGNAVIKTALKAQLDGIIKPYLGFVPATLALLLFITLTSLTSLLNLLLYPLLWMTFLILEKTGFVRYEIEMRQVKKLIV